MVFSSAIFLLAFLPIVFSLNFLIKKPCRIRQWILLAGLLFALCVSLLFLTKLLAPKWTSALATSSTVDGFYAEEEDSLDVIFYGSSQIVLGVSPMEIYEKYGIKSYDLATGSQPFGATRYWVEETHRTQPQAVAVVEVMLALDEGTMSEGAIRESLDEMHFSGVKNRAIQSICETYELDTADFYFPLLRYHDRWEELTKEDFTYLWKDKTFVRKGYYPLAGYEYSEFEGLDFPETEDVKEENVTTAFKESNRVEEWDIVSDADSDTNGKDGLENETNSVEIELAEIPTYNAAYLQETIDYCKENNIPLLLLKTPLIKWTVAQHNTIQKIADENGVTFLDMNDKTIYQEMEIDPAYDFQGADHLNSKGAKKVSDYLGEYLIENYGVDKTGNEGKKERLEETWHSQLQAYNRLLKNEELKLETDANHYYDLVMQDEDYVIVMVYQDNGTEDFSEEFVDIPVKYGLDQEKIQDRETKYIRILDGGNPVWDWNGAEDACVAFGENGSSTDSMTQNASHTDSGHSDDTEKQESDNALVGDTNLPFELVVSVSATDKSILIDGTEYGVPRSNGLHLVIYSKTEKKVVDSVTFGPVPGGDIYWPIRNWE